MDGRLIAESTHDPAAVAAREDWRRSVRDTKKPPTVEEVWEAYLASPVGTPNALRMLDWLRNRTP